VSPSRREADAGEPEPEPGPHPDAGAPLRRVLAAVLLVAAAVTGAVVAEARSGPSAGPPAATATAAPGETHPGTADRTPGMAAGRTDGTSDATSDATSDGGSDARSDATPGPASGSAAAMRPDLAQQPDGAQQADGAQQPDGGKQSRERALTALLAVRSRAVMRGDARGWLSTVDRSATAFRARQAEVFENLRDVPLAQWSYRYVGVAPALPSARRRELGPSAWVARVLVGHRIRGFDTATSYSEQFLTVVHRRGGWVLAADDDGDGAPQPWDLGRVRVERGRHVLVLGTAPTRSLRGFAVEADRAVEQVSQVWGNQWPRRAVLVVPRTQTEFGRLLLRDRKGLGQVAAVTTGDLGLAPGDRVASSAGGTSNGGRLARNDRVVLNPAAFDRLAATGRRVVLTHEVTHVAVRSSTSSAVPIWLSEGFADYVGYRGSGVGRRTAAADVLALVRQGRGPTSLPTAADFDPTRATIAPSYSSALLACDLLVDTYGEQGLVRLYRAATERTPNGGPDPQARLASAFPRALGTSQQRFTADWRQHLSRLAR